MSYIAVHRIERVNKDKKRESIAPGSPFTPNDNTERDQLLAIGAIRKLAEVKAEEAAADAKPSQKAGKGKNDDKQPAPPVDEEL